MLILEVKKKLGKKNQIILLYNNKLLIYFVSSSIWKTEDSFINAIPKKDYCITKVFNLLSINLSILCHIFQS